MLATAPHAAAATAEQAADPIVLVADPITSPPGPLCVNNAFGRYVEAYHIEKAKFRHNIRGGLPGDSIQGTGNNGFPYRDAFAHIQIDNRAAALWSPASSAGNPCGFYENFTGAFYNHCAAAGRVQIHVVNTYIVDDVELCVEPGVTHLGTREKVHDAYCCTRAADRGSAGATPKAGGRAAVGTLASCG